MNVSPSKSIMSAWHSGNVEETKRLLDIYDKNLTPRLLVVKGKCLQLVREPVPLEVIETCFRKAISIEPSYIPALLELGWFLRNVKNDPQAALRYFRKAYRLSNQYLRESISGIALSENELLP